MTEKNNADFFAAAILGIVRHHGIIIRGLTARIARGDSSDPAHDAAYIEKAMERLERDIRTVFSVEMAANAEEKKEI